MVVEVHWFVALFVTLETVNLKQQGVAFESFLMCSLNGHQRVVLTSVHVYRIFERFNLKMIK